MIGPGPNRKGSQRRGCHTGKAHRAIVNMAEDSRSYFKAVASAYSGQNQPILLWLMPNRYCLLIILGSMMGLNPAPW
jgi:hypothetical protein